MEAVQIHTRATDGRIEFDLPAEYTALANARVLVLVVPEPDLTSSTAEPVRQFPATDWDALDASLAAVVALNPYRTIEDPVQWQRELRDEGERPLPGRS